MLKKGNKNTKSVKKKKNTKLNITVNGVYLSRTFLHFFKALHTPVTTGSRVGLSVLGHFDTYDAE